MIIRTGLIPRIAFEIFEIPIYWYAIIIVFAMGISILWCKFHDGRYGVKFDELLDLAIFILPISILGARIYYVLFTFDYFKNNPSEILKINNGGLAIYGGLIAGLITILIFAKIKKKKVLDTTDFIAPTIALAQSIGRWGNYINIEAYGYETNWPIKMEIIESGVTKYVHPTFLYEAISTFIIFIILTLISKKRKFPGQITYLYIIFYAFARFFVEGLRTDSLMLFNFRISQILSLLLFIIFSSILCINENKHKNMSKKVEKCQ